MDRNLYNPGQVSSGPNGPVRVEFNTPFRVWDEASSAVNTAAPEVRILVDELNKALYGLADAQGTLIGRIEYVLRPLEGMPKQETAPCPYAQGTLAYDLWLITRTVNSLAANVRETLTALQI